MKHIKLNKRTLIRWKIYIDRARMYIGYVQFFMIGFVFFESFRDQPIGELIFNNLYVAVPMLFALFIVLSLIVGFLDTKAGLREEELRNLSSSNPVLREIHANMHEMKLEVQQLREALEKKNP